MAVPKRKKSRSTTRHRRSQWKAKPPGLVSIVIDGKQVLVPRSYAKAAHLGLLMDRFSSGRT